MNEVLLTVKSRGVVGGQYADGGDAQGQVFDGVEAQIHHRVADGGDLLGQAVIGRVDDSQHLDGDHRIFVNHLYQIFGCAIDVTRQRQDLLDAFRKRRHAVNG